MTTFKVPSAEEYDQPKAKYGLLGEAEYKVKIDSYQRQENQIGQYNTDGHDTFRIYLKPLESVDDPDTDLVDVDGEVIDPEKYVTFFFDPTKMGLKPQPSKSRKFLAAALQQPITQGFSAKSPEDALDQILGKELIAYVSIKGEYNNVMDVRPAKRATAPTRARSKSVAVEDTEY